jgi:hypothetical protein
MKEEQKLVIKACIICLRTTLSPELPSKVADAIVTDVIKILEKSLTENNI